MSVISINSIVPNVRPRTRSFSNLTEKSSSGSAYIILDISAKTNFSSEVHIGRVRFVVVRLGGVQNLWGYLPG